jgi:hypothetical protein
MGFLIPLSRAKLRPPDRPWDFRSPQADVDRATNKLGQATSSDSARRTPATL